MPAISNHATEDLRQAVAYLSGLAVILEQLHTEGRGRGGGDVLLEKLEAMQQGVSEWAPLRYQIVGMGWEYVSKNIRELAGRLEKELGRLGS